MLIYYKKYTRIGTKRITDYSSIVTLSFSDEVRTLIDRLLTWKPNTMEEFTEEQEKYLHAEGEMEMVLMAQRYAERFPSLLKGHYHPELFKFRSTYTQR